MVDPKLGRECVEREQFALALMLADRLAGAHLEIRRCQTAAAVHVRSVSSGTARKRANSSCETSTDRRISQRAGRALVESFEKANARHVAQNHKTGHSVRWMFAVDFLRSEIGEFSRKWRARKD